MIYKTLSRHTPSYGGLISYIQKEGKGKLDKPVSVFTHGFKSIDKDGWIAEMKLNESYRKFEHSKKVYLRHSILSLSPKENPQFATREVMEDLARKYIELRGLDAQYVVGIHEDKGHLHCHIAESGLKLFTGRAHSMTKAEMHQLKIDLDTYQKDKYPGLIYSVPEHGKGAEYLKDVEWHIQNRKNERTLSKISIQQRVSEIYTNSKNRTDFLTQLRDIGLHHYEREDKVQGIVDELGYKFRFSRLDIAFEALPIDVIELSQEEQILKEIQNIREERNNEIEREHFMDMERYIHLNPNSLLE